MHTTPSLLIVEDDPIIAMDLEDMAIRAGWRVVGPATSLSLALIAAASESIDYALLDFNLGHGSNSIPVAETLSNRQVAYCFVTSTDPSEVRLVNPRAKLVPKPMSQAELQNILNVASRQLKH